MKISELPQATEITGEEILPVVQNGETKKVNRDDLVGTVPDGIRIENGTVTLLSNGETVGESASLPEITIDGTLSTTSENAVQNKAVTEALNGKIGDENGSVQSNHLANGSVTEGKLSEEVKIKLNKPQIPVDSELSAESENPVQNRAIAKAIENSKPMLITFNNSDFDNSDSQQLPIGISFKLNQSRIMLIATFDVSRWNFRISDGSDYSIYKVLIEGEPFDLSMLDEYIKSMETLESDYGEGWIVEGSQYAYMHEYSFGNVDNANTVFAELSEMGLNGFQLLVNNYNKITAKEV